MYTAADALAQHTHTRTQNHLGRMNIRVCPLDAKDEAACKTLERCAALRPALHCTALHLDAAA